MPIEAAHGAALAGDTKYPPQDGQPALKRAIQRKFQRDSGLDYALDEVTVGNGGKGVIFNALMATVDEGDEVLIPAPYWGAYPLMTRVVGGEPVTVNCPQNNGFKLRPEDLDAAITPRTKWLVLELPQQPDRRRPVLRTSCGRWARSCCAIRTFGSCRMTCTSTWCSTAPTPRWPPWSRGCATAR